MLYAPPGRRVQHDQASPCDTLRASQVEGDQASAWRELLNKKVFCYQSVERRSIGRLGANASEDSGEPVFDGRTTTKALARLRRGKEHCGVLGEAGDERRHVEILERREERCDEAFHRL